MSTAEITNSLRQKDIEKTVALEEIRNAEGFRARGFAGKLYVSLVGVRGFDGQSSGASLTYTLTPLDYGESLPADELKGGVAGHLLISRDVVLSLCLEVPMNANPQLYEVPPQVTEGEEVPGKELDASPVPTTASYYAEFDCKELPDEGYMQLELIGKNEGQIHADLKFVIKVSYEEFAKLIADKVIELEQIQKQMKNLNSTSKDTSRTKSGKVKKQKKEVSSGDKVAQYASEGDDIGPSNFEIAYHTAEAVAAFAVSTRSYLLFGVAAVGIYYFGEYASI